MNIAAPLANAPVHTCLCLALGAKARAVEAVAITRTGAAGLRGGRRARLRRVSRRRRRARFDCVCRRGRRKVIKRGRGRNGRGGRWRANRGHVEGVGKLADAGAGEQGRQQGDDDFGHGGFLSPRRVANTFQ